MLNLYTYKLGVAHIYTLNVLEDKQVDYFCNLYLNLIVVLIIDDDHDRYN